jgi:nucleoside-diphosphate-sugar epimerase
MPSRLIPSILVNALQNKQINLSSPNFVRDFIYVKDFVDFCILLALVKPEQQYVFNAGTGVQSTIKDVIKAVQAIVKKPLDICWGASIPRPWEPKVWQANIDKAKEFLGWTPKYLLKDGLTESLNWFDQNINCYSPSLKNVINCERKSGPNIFTKTTFVSSGKADQAYNP